MQTGGTYRRTKYTHTGHTKKRAKVPVGIVGQTDRLTTSAYTALAQRRSVQILFKTQQKVYSKVIYNAVQHACQKADNGKLTEMQSVTRSQLLRSVRSAWWHSMVGERRHQLKLSKTARRKRYVLLSCHLGWMNMRRFCLQKGRIGRRRRRRITTHFCPFWHHCKMAVT